MRGRDAETGEFLDDSRSAKRREALEVLALAEVLMATSHAVLDKLPMPEDLRALVKDSQRITSHIARKRQTQFLAKHMRREEDETLEAIRGALHHDKADSRRETAALHRLEHWRERLMDEGDAALSELLALFPQADRQHLRQLARNAKAERLQHKPLHAFRELFRELKALFDAEPPPDANDEADAGADTHGDDR
jgi:ribosome-associated protein